jgi:hypothetical protein
MTQEILAAMDTQTPDTIKYKGLDLPELAREAATVARRVHQSIERVRIDLCNLAAIIHEGKTRCRDNETFGKWFDSLDLGFDKNNRAALVEFGRNYAKWAPILANATSNSPRYIRENEERKRLPAPTPKSGPGPGPRITPTPPSNPTPPTPDPTPPEKTPGTKWRHDSGEYQRRSEYRTGVVFKGENGRWKYAIPHTTHGTPDDSYFDYPTAKEAMAAADHALSVYDEAYDRTGRLPRKKKDTFEPQSWETEPSDYAEDEEDDNDDYIPIEDVEDGEEFAERLQTLDIELLREMMPFLTTYLNESDKEYEWVHRKRKGDQK